VRGAVAGGGGLGCVLLVSNLNETDTEPDHLFILFGVYGDVQVPNRYDIDAFPLRRDAVLPQFYLESRFKSAS
jgi:hypothetical protein